MAATTSMKITTKNSNFNALFEMIEDLEKKQYRGLKLWNTLIETGHDTIERLAANVLRSYNDNRLSAGDLSHDVIVELTRRFFRMKTKAANPSPFGQHDGVRSLAPYLSHIIHLQLRRAAWRARGRRQEECKRLTKVDMSSSFTPSNESEYFDSFETREVRAQVIQAVNELPEECRLVVAAYYLGGDEDKKTVRGIADELGIPPSTVQDRLKKGLALLKNRFGVPSP